MYQIRKNSKSSIGLHKYWLVMLLASSLLIAKQSPAVESNNAWLDLVKQDPVAAPLQISKFEDLARIALTNSSELKANYAAWMMKQEEMGTITGLPDPNLSLGYFLEPVETAQGPQKAKLSLGQTIPWISKTRAVKQAKRAQMDQVYEALHHAKLNLIKELGILWAEAEYLQAATNILEQKVAYASDLEAILTTQYKSASISHRKYAQVQIQTLDLEEELQSFKDRQFRLGVDLMTILELDAPLQLSEIQLDPIPEHISENMVHSHPRLEQLEKMLQQTKAQQSFAKASYMPDMRLGLDYILTDPKTINGAEVDGSGKNPLAISFGIAVPIWNWGKKRSAVEASQWDQKRVQAVQSREKTLLHQEYNNAYSILMENMRQRALYNDELLPKAREIVQIMEQAYISQSVDIETYTQARQKLLDLELKLAGVNHSARIQASILTYLRGE